MNLWLRDRRATTASSRSARWRRAWSSRPGRPFFAGEPPRPFLRLTFAAEPPDRLAAAVARLRGIME